MDLNKQCPAGQLSSVPRTKDSWALETPTGLRPHLTDQCLPHRLCDLEDATQPL